MSIPASGAASAYSQIARLANQGPEAQRSEAAGGFADMLQDQFRSLVAQGNASEAAQAGMLSQGTPGGSRADVVDVVTAVAETELALETLVSVRDRVISAYEEIMRMPI